MCKYPKCSGMQLEVDTSFFFLGAVHCWCTSSFGHLFALLIFPIVADKVAVQDFFAYVGSATLNIACVDEWVLESRGSAD